MAKEKAPVKATPAPAKATEKPVKAAAKPAKATETKAPEKATKTAAPEKAAKAPAKAPVKAATPEKAAKAPAKATAAKPVAEKSSEKVIVEGATGTPHGKFVIKCTDNKNFVFKLFSANKRVVAISAGFYNSLSACKTGIQSVINNAANAPIEDRTLKNPTEQKCPKWVIFNDKRGEVRLQLIATNGNMVASTNDGYLSKDAAKKGIDAVARAAQGADIVRNDDLW